MNNDSRDLEIIYEQINEGIWDRLKGQGAGIKAGFKQGVQNVAANVANKLGANVATSGQTMGQAYAKSQQKSIFNSFVQKAQKEIQEFEQDMIKLGKQDLNALKASHPEIEQLIKSYKTLLVYLGGQKANINRIK